MNAKISKTIPDGSGFLYERLDQVLMSGHERMRAKAQLARAEAAADALGDFVHLIKRLLTALVVRPVRRLTASIA